MTKLYAIFIFDGFDWATGTNLRPLWDGFDSEEDAETNLRGRKWLPNGEDCKGHFIILPYYVKK